MIPLKPSEFYDLDPDDLRAVGVHRVRLTAHRAAFTPAGARATDCRESHGFTLSLDDVWLLRPLPHTGIADCRCRYVPVGPRQEIG